MIVPTLRSDDVIAHARFLTDVLGLVPGHVSEGHVELFRGEGVVLLGPRRPDHPEGHRWCFGTYRPTPPSPDQVRGG